jgi:tripartite-type tricarboxylate transporter receptor subunit TctC
MNKWMRMSKKAFTAAIVMVLLLAGVSALGAQSKKASFPTRPVTFIIGWATGGGSDIVAGCCARRRNGIWDSPSSSSTSREGPEPRRYVEIANSKPDGYVIGNTTGTISTHKFMGVIPIASEAFEVVTTFNSDPGAIWVAQDSPYKTLKDLVEAARKNPETITIASSNPGSITRFGTLMLEKVAGIRFKIVSQSGGEAEGPNLVAGGHVVACQAAVVTALSLYQAGLIRPLGVMDDERIASFPEIPTYKEQATTRSSPTTGRSWPPRARPRTSSTPCTRRSRRPPSPRSSRPS